jgi:transposase
VPNGRFVYQRDTEKFNSDTFGNFLRHLYRHSVHRHRRVVAISDNAGYHHGKPHAPWREKHAGRFDLEFLPPYSPDLNPIERVWKLTRRLCTHNKYFPTIDAIVQAVEAAFAPWSRPNDTLRRLCAII